MPVRNPAMKIKILGNGGAINDRLPYNSFIIDNKILVEAPPDIMLSLGREYIPFGSIEDIYISHMHGDHYFGFPFLAMRLFFNYVKGEKYNRITIYSPDKGKESLLDLTAKAFSEGHPLIRWIEDNMDFINISGRNEISIAGLNLKLFPTEHSIETYGFVANDRTENLFAYIPDTKWSGKIERILKEKPHKIILDLNGEPDDPVPVHLSERDITEKAFNIVKPETIFYGTHLKYKKESRCDRIKYVHPGMEIEI